MTRRIVSVFGIMLTWAVGAPAARAELVCPEPVVQLGEVRSGVPLAQRFTIVNRGREAAEVTEVRPSCGCLAPRLEPRRLRPGEEGLLFLDINTLTQPEGPHAWRIAVRYRQSGQEGELALFVYARVVAEISLQPPMLMLYTDSTISHEITLTDRRPQPLAVTASETTSPWLRTRVGEPRREPDGRWTRTISLEVLPGFPEGRHDGAVRIVSADPTYPELKVPLSVVKRSRQQVSITPGAVTLSGTRGEPLPSRIVLLAAEDGREVVVERVAADDPAIRCTWAKGPGPRATLRIRVDQAGLPGAGLRSGDPVYLGEGARAAGHAPHPRGPGGSAGRGVAEQRPRSPPGAGAAGLDRAGDVYVALRGLRRGTTPKSERGALAP
jgi:hypothetical protein